MSEERIKKRCKREDIALKIVKGFLEKDCYTDTELEYSLNTLLDLYNKQKEEIQSLENQLDFIGEQNKYIDRLEYLIKKKDAYIEELENWTKEHPSVIPIPEEIREEAEKLGHFADLVTIEEKEYISKDKIRDKILELTGIKGELEEKDFGIGFTLEDYYKEITIKIKAYKELLEED